MSARYVCEHCGREVTRTTEICPGCGKRLIAIKCLNCGFTGQAENFVGDRCPNCGSHNIIPDGDTGNNGPGLGGCVLVIISAGLLLVGIFICSDAYQQLVTAWSNFMKEVVAWLEFIGSLLLSLVSLGGVTLLLLGMFVLLMYLLGVLGLPVSMLKARARLVSTAANLFCGLCALLIVSWLFQRPPDYWDFGIQFLIAFAIEVAIFRFL